MKIFRWLIVGVIMVVLSACGGGGGTPLDDGSYTLTEGNHALMGPLKGAEVSVYRLVDVNHSIEQTTTDSMGAFSLGLNGIVDDEIVFVQVSGGIDIDADDDGVLDATLTTNKGTLHALVSAKSLRAGQANVTLISEIVYQFSKHLLGKISNDDLSSIMNVIGAKLLKNGVSDDGSVYTKLITGFNPTEKELTEALSFDYLKLISGEDSLASVIYAGDKDVEAKVAELFLSVLSMGDSSLLALKNQVKLSLMPPIEADVTSSGASLFIKQENNTSKLSEYIEKGEDITLSVAVNDGYKILRWHGCDTVSADQKTCSLSGIQEDSVVTPVVVSDEIVVNPDIVIRDLTGAAIDISSATYSCVADSANLDLQTILESVEIGDVIVNKVEPVFFKKVTAVTRTDALHYTYEAEFIALEEVITQGYLSSSSSMDASTQNAKLISSSAVYIAPNGKKVALNSDDSNMYELDFSRLAKVVVEKDFPMEEYELVEGVKVKGGIKVGIGFEVDMDWRFVGGLRYLHVEPEVTLAPNISLSIEGEKKFGGADSEYNIGLIRNSQVFLIGVVPIVVSEDIRVSIGAEGSVKASYSVGADASFGIGFPLTWNEKSGLHFETVDKKFSFNVDVAKYTIEAEAGGYLNVMPTVNVYGFGIGLANKVGIYGKVGGTAGLTLSYGTDGAKAEVAKAYAEIFLQYQPEFRLITPELTSGNTFFKDLKEKFSAKFPPLLKVTKTLWKNEVALDTTIVTPGKLEVVGYNYIDEIVQGDSLKKSLVYILKNTGGEDLYWKASMFTKKTLFVDEMLYPSSGKLSPDATIEVRVEIDQAEVTQVGEQGELLNFFASAKDLTVADPFMINIMDRIIPKASFGLDLIVHPKLAPIENATLQVEGTEVKQMMINYDLSTDDIDGYVIYKADYNQTNKFCYDNYAVFATLTDKTQSRYSVGLDALMQSADTTRKIEAGHAYCFNIVSYKDENKLHSTSPLMETPVILDLSSGGEEVPVDLVTGLVAHYEFEGNANDSSGNGNNGTEHGGVSYVDGVIGQAGSFDGADDYIKVSKDLSLSSYTLSTWYKTTNTDIQALITYGESYDTDKMEYSLFLNKNCGSGTCVSTWYEVDNDDDYFFSHDFDVLNQWYLVTVTKSDNGDMSLFVNGIKYETTNSSPQQSNINHFLTLGSRTNSNPDIFQDFFKGNLDDVRIYNRALNQAEVETLYRMGQKVDIDDGLVAHYEFEGNANDSSGNGNNGTEYGGVSYVDGVMGQAGSFDGASNIKTPIELIGEEENQYLTISFWGMAEDESHSTFVTNYNYGDGANSIGFTARNAGITGGFSGYYSNGFCYKYIRNNLLEKIDKEETNSCGTIYNRKDIYDDGATPVDYTKWHHYSITYNNHDEKIFIDGKKVIEREMESSLIGGENGVENYPRNDNDYDRFLNIGMYNNFQNRYSQSTLNQYTLKGKIDDLRIYKRVLNESEIEALYEMRE